MLASCVQGIATLFSYWKEGRDWQRKDASAHIAWQREQKRADDLAIRAAFQSAIQGLSIIVADREIRGDREKYEPDKTLLAECISSVSLLLLRFPDAPVRSNFSYFRGNPGSYAESLVVEVIKLASDDDALVPFMKRKEPQVTAVDSKHRVNFAFDDEYRKRRFIEGIVLPERYSIEFLPTEIDESERALLVEAIPRIVRPSSASVPLPNPRTKDGKESYWRARIDPGTARDILKSWATDYAAAISLQNAEVNQVTSN